MSTKRVRANAVYRYNPVPIDRFDPPYGVQTGELQTGDLVRVVNKYGCPKANTMGHCYIETVGTRRFLGLVCTNSLESCHA